MPEDNEFFDPELDGPEGSQDRRREDLLCVIDGDIQKIRDDQYSTDTSLASLRKAHVFLNKTLVYSLVLLGIFMLVLSYVFMTEIKSLRTDRAEFIQKLEKISLKLQGLEKELEVSSPNVCLRRFDDRVRDLVRGKPVTGDIFIEEAACALRAGATDEQVGFLVEHLIEYEIELFKKYSFYEAFKEGKKEVVKIELTALIHRRSDYR